MIGFYNVSVILTYAGVVSAVFGMSAAFNGNFKIAMICLMISGFTDMYDGTVAKMIKRSDDAKNIYLLAVLIISLLFVIDFSVFKPGKKCMFAFVIIGILIAVRIYFL